MTPESHAHRQARQLSLLGGLVATGLLLAACSTAATPSPTPAAPSAAPPSPTESAAPSAAASPSAAAGETYEVTVATDAKLGKYLAGEDGKTLYTFKKDTANTRTARVAAPRPGRRSRSTPASR